LEYFEGALADAPASARPVASTAAAIMASIPVTVARRLYIAPSLWLETTQAEQVLMFPIDAVRRLVVPAVMVILIWAKRKN
jgi:hypothetical protein